MVFRSGAGRGWLWRLSRDARLTAALVLTVAAASVGALAYWPSNSRADEVTASVGALRDGWDPQETTGALSPATVSGASFGELFGTSVDGQVYAQPVVVGNTVIVATENDYVYSLNAATGSVNWSKSLGTPWPSAAENCTDLNPNVGVTSTPVYDPASGYVYLVAEVVPAGGSVLHPVFYLHALSPMTGAERSGWPVRIGGSPTNDRTAQFTPFTLLQRPGLLLTDGSVYAAFASHCDFQPYRGYVVGVNVTSTKAQRSQTMWTDESGITDAMAGIWQSGGGLMSDGKGQIIFASGNGVSPAPGPGSKPPGELAESVVRLVVQSDGSLVAKDFFSPVIAPLLDSLDRDLGSGGPTGLPFGSAAYPHLLVQGGKRGSLFLLNRDHLGGRKQGPNGTDAVVSEILKGLKGQYGHPAAFADTTALTATNFQKAKDYVYYVGDTDPLRYLKAGLASNGKTVVLSDVAQSSDVFGLTSGSPVVTSSGQTPGSAVLWVVNSSKNSGATGMLQAYPAVPPTSCTTAKPCTIKPLWFSAPFTNAGKFTIPATDNGRVYIGTRGPVTTTATGCGGVVVPAGTSCGQVFGFGSPSLAPLGAASPAAVDFGQVAAGHVSAQRAVTITNKSAATVTVESVTTASTTSPDPFAQAGPYVINQASTPASCTMRSGTTASTCELQPGDTLTVPAVTFSPASPGADTGALEFELDPAKFPNSPAVSVGLSGTGTQPGFGASPSSVNFGNVAVGTTASAQVTITNTDATAEDLTTTAPGGPFTVTGLPSPTQAIPPGESVTVTINYTPAGQAGDSGTLSLTGDATDAIGAKSQVGLSGTGVPDISPTLKVTGSTSVNFGSVRLGSQAQRTITIANKGNLPALVTATSPLRVPFGLPDPVPAGLPLTPATGYVLNVPVTFTPTSPGTVRSSYRVTWTDAAGPHSLAVPLTGTGVRPASGIAVPPPGGGWTLNGTAHMAGTAVSLNTLTKGSAGSAVYSNPVLGNGLQVRFTTRIGGGNGADGLTLSLLDASKTDAGALGRPGSGLGYGGLPGVAVTLDTFDDGPGYPSANFVGIATGVRSTGLLRFAATARNVPALRRGAHVVGVTVARRTITVTVDGKKVLAKAVALPRFVLLGFTGATGSRTDRHVVGSVHITAGGRLVPPPGGGWSYNGSAAVSGSDSVLTRAKTGQAGSVVYPVPVPAVGLRVTFDAQLGGGSGGDGMTLALLNPAKTTARTVGRPGTMLGLGNSRGVPGVGIVLGTDGAATRIGPPADFVAITTAATWSGLTFQQWAQGIAPLTTGTHLVTVTVTRSGTLGIVVTIWLDGVRVLAAREPHLTTTVRLAFTAGTSTTLTNRHIVRDVAIAASR